MNQTIRIVAPFIYLGIDTADQRACAECWHGSAQQDFAPLPEVDGHVESGIRFRRSVIRSRDALEAQRPGAALMFIFGSDAEPVLIAGIARRLEPAAEKHVAMVPVLGEVVRLPAWTWLRVRAYYQQQNGQ